MRKKSTLVQFAGSLPVLAHLSSTITVDAQQVKYRMTTDIPASITTPDTVKTLFTHQPKLKR